MLTLIDLQKFCAREPSLREYLYSPWRADHSIYASNGHVIIAVNDDGRELPERTAQHPKNADQICQIPEGLTWIAIAPEDCLRCRNTGRVDDENCDICTGRGEFECGSHSYYCKECAGEGVINGPCPHCSHNGQVILGLKIAHRYIRLISELPNPSFGFLPGEEKKVWFRCEGGHGVVMSMRA